MPARLWLAGLVLMVAASGCCCFWRPCGCRRCYRPIVPAVVVVPAR